MHETRTDELAGELLDVVNPTELEGFVRALVAETARAGGRRLSAPAAEALAAELQQTAERTLPSLTVALGRRALPAAPAAARNAARLYGLELEGMSPEDRDFEIARRFVRFAEAATRTA